MFYERYVALCEAHGVTPSRAAMEAGLSKSTVSKWKASPEAKPTGNAIKKLCDYFGITVSELLEEETPIPAAVSDRDIMFALFGGRADITEEMYEEVKAFANFVYQREEAKKQK